MAIRKDWLDLVQEPIIDPDRPIIDPHHHLWDHADSRYLIHELLEDTNSGHNIAATVFVECAAMFRAEGPHEMKAVGETEFVQGVAAMSASGGYGAIRACAGIVSFADLNLGSDVRAVLEAHIAASGNRFRGIRHAAGWDADPDVKNSHSHPTEGMLKDATFRAGFAELAPLNLSFDAWCYHHQLPDLIDLARAFPETTIILDHFGGPLGIGPWEGKHDSYFPQWQEDIRTLAECENVVAKLGGINMAVNGFGWHLRDTPPTSDELNAATARWYEHTIECFGAHRCMFESNFPVDKNSVSYPVLWNAFKKLASGCSEAEKHALFFDTAKRVYRLDLP